MEWDRYKPAEYPGGRSDNVLTACLGSATVPEAAGGSDEPLKGCAPERSLWTRRNVIGFLMVGVLGLIPASAFLAWGIDRSTASNAALIYLTVPIITAMLAAAILKENDPCPMGELCSLARRSSDSFRL